MLITAMDKWLERNSVKTQITANENRKKICYRQDI